MVFSFTCVQDFIFLLIGIRCSDASATCIDEFICLVAYLLENSAGRMVIIFTVLTCMNSRFNRFIAATTYGVHFNRKNSRGGK